MATLTRRRFVLLSTVALLGAACAPSEPEKGLRGSGSVYHPRELSPVVMQPTAAPPTPVVAPTAQPKHEPIVPADAVPAAVAGGTDAQAHVVPVPTKAPIVQPLPARRIVIPTIGLDSKIIQLGTKL